MTWENGFEFFWGSLLHWWIEDILLETNASGHNDKSRRILRKKYTYHLKSWNWSSWRIGYVCQKGCWMPKQSLLSVMTTDILVSDIFFVLLKKQLSFLLGQCQTYSRCFCSHTNVIKTCCTIFLTSLAYKIFQMFFKFYPLITSNG